MGAASSKSTKHALLVGCNYPEEKACLRGCVEDVRRWTGVLTGNLGFKEAKIQWLVDEPGSEGNSLSPTGENIRRELKRLMKESKPGDLIFFHFSGHGAQLPADEDGQYEGDGLDEALVPTDFDLVLADQMRDMLCDLNPRVQFVMVADCGHSKGMLNHLRTANCNGEAAGEEESLTEEMEALKQTKEVGYREVPSIGPTRDRLGASMKLVEGHAPHRTTVPGTGDTSTEAAKGTRVSTSTKNTGGTSMEAEKGILIASCQYDQKSAEVKGSDGKWFGLLTYVLTSIISQHEFKRGRNPLTYHSLVTKATCLIKQMGYEQTPGLECSAENDHSSFNTPCSK